MTLILTTAGTTATDRQDTAAEPLRQNVIRVQTTAANDTDPFTALIDEIPGHDAIVMS